MLIGRQPARRRAGGIAWRDVLNAAAIANVLALVVFAWVIWQRTDPNRDSLAYHALIARLHRGGPIYWPLPPLAPQTRAAPYYLYPPFLAALLSLVPPVAWVTFSRIWSVMALAGFGAYALALGKLACGRLTARRVLVALLVLTWFPGGTQAVAFGQIDPVLWALVGWGIAWSRFRGPGLVLSGLVKPFTVIPLGVAVCREGRRVVVPALAVAVTAVGGSALALGPAAFVMSFLEWLRHVAPSIAHGSFDPWNVSLSFLPLRGARARGWIEIGHPLPTWARCYLTATMFAVPAGMAWLLRRRRVDLQCAASAAAAVLFAPICWTTYLPMLLLPGAAMLGARRTVAGSSEGEERCEATRPVPADLGS